MDPHRDANWLEIFLPDKSDPSAVELHLHARPEGRTSHQRSPDARHVRYGRLRDHPVRPRAPARRDGRPQGRARAHRLQGWGSGGPRPPRAYRRASPRRARAAREALPAPDVAPAVIAEVADGLEGGIQAIYLGSLLAILGFAGFIIVRQVLIRRELDDSAKKMGERIRAGNATAEEYFEMGSIMLRKKVFTQAVRNLKLAAQMWEGDKEDLAQIPQRPRVGYLLHRQGRRGHRRVQQGCRAHAGVRDGVEQPGGCAGAEEGVQGCHRGLRGVSHPVARTNKVATVRLDEIREAGASRDCGTRSGRSSRAIRNYDVLLVDDETPRPRRRPPRVPSGRVRSRPLSRRRLIIRIGS